LREKSPQPEADEPLAQKKSVEIETRGFNPNTRAGNFGAPPEMIFNVLCGCTEIVPKGSLRENPSIESYPPAHPTILTLLQNRTFKNLGIGGGVQGGRCVC